MKTKVTKKNIEELVSIVKSNGYWSETVREYLEQFEYNARVRLDTKAKAIIRLQQGGCF